jgi:pyridinium-3,5-biscarboxylic acid mononucleotide sulfurtransferase
MNLQNKYILLQSILKGLGKVVVAYSGGVDSTFLLKVAVDTLGRQNVLACIAQGPSLPQSQYRQAVKLAKKISAKLETVEPNEMADPHFIANNANRCFHCKAHLMKLLTGIAKEKGFNKVVCGHNLDDNKDYRPGLLAIKKFKIECPLADAQLTKEDIRKLSRKLSLPTADMSASPCLASRICYGLEITEKRLRQIEQAEEYLKKLGLVEFRVRHHDTVVRIEVHPQDFKKITEDPNRSKIIVELKGLGFKYVTIDLQGFRSGAMNEMLSKNDKS